MTPRFQLTPYQVEQVQQVIATTSDAKRLRRALCCLFVHQGLSVIRCSALLGIKSRTIYSWLEDSLAMGGAWQDRDSLDVGGRPEKWNDEIDSILEAALAHRPDQLGYARTQWTSILLREHLMNWTGEVFSARTIRRHLTQLGYVWKRPRYALVPDQRLKEKQRKIREKVSSLSNRSALLFVDETDLLLFPALRSSWTKRGEPNRVTITGWNEKRVIFGALHICTGNLILNSRDRNRAPDFRYFLHLLRAHYRGWHLVLLLDEGPSHVARTTELLANGMEIELIWLPHRSPELNPLETLWGKAKTALAANRQFQDIDEQADTFIAHLLKIPSEIIMTISGLASDDFWLWKNCNRLCPGA